MKDIMDINLTMLEMQDEVRKNDYVIKYHQLEKEIENNTQLKKNIDLYNELVNEYEKVEYDPYRSELLNRIQVLKDDVESNPLYQDYLAYTDALNSEIVDLGSLIFKDLLEIGDVFECGKR